MPKKKAEPGSLAWNIGANVRRLRKPTGMSQEALAHVCGYHRTYVGMIERAIRVATWNARWARCNGAQ